MEVDCGNTLSPKMLGISSSRTGFIQELVEDTDGYARGPERALLAAILFDGIQSYFHSGMSVESKARRREAAAWMAKKDDPYIFSFSSVCEALGINPSWLKIGLQNVKLSNPSLFKGKRRNGLDSVIN